MDWISKEFLLAVCGSFLIALIAVAWPSPLVQSPPPQTTESAQRATEANESSDRFHYARFSSYVDLAATYCTSESPNRQEEWGKKFICESKITDAVIAILTFFLAIFTGLLVRVGARQERTTRQQMRAFVYLDKGSIINVADPIATLPGYQPSGAEIQSPTEGPLAFLTIRNSGSTPAFKVEHWGGMAIDDFPLRGSLPGKIAMQAIPSSSIPPEGINTKNVRLANPLNQADLDGLRNGTRAIYIYGEIIYFDAFRRKRQTNYRLIHNSMSGAIGISTDLTWTEGGNDAT